MGGFRAIGFRWSFGKPMPNSKEAVLLFVGSNGRIRVSNQESCIVCEGGCGRVWGGWEVSSVEELK
jgi:hypothetical protein